MPRKHSSSQVSLTDFLKVAARSSVGSQTTITSMKLLSALLVHVLTSMSAIHGLHSFEMTPQFQHL